MRRLHSVPFLQIWGGVPRSAGGAVVRKMCVLLPGAWLRDGVARPPQRARRISCAACMLGGCRCAAGCAAGCHGMLCGGGAPVARCISPASGSGLSVTGEAGCMEGQHARRGAGIQEHRAARHAAASLLRVRECVCLAGTHAPAPCGAPAPICPPLVLRSPGCSQNSNLRGRGRAQPAIVSSRPGTLCVQRRVAGAHSRSQARALPRAAPSPPARPCACAHRLWAMGQVWPRGQARREAISGHGTEWYLYR